VLLSTPAGFPQRQFLPMHKAMNSPRLAPSSILVDVEDANLGRCNVIQVMLATQSHRIARLSPRIVGVALLGLLLVASLFVALTGGEHSTMFTLNSSRIDASAVVPEGWHTQSFDNNLGLATHTGVLVSNVDHTFEYPDLSGGRATSSWDMGDLPPHAVVVEISEVVRIPVRCNSEGEGDMPVTNFPLSLDEANAATTRSNQGEPHRRYIGVCLRNGKHFGVHTGFFPQASDGDRKLAKEIVSSIETSP